MNDVLPLTFIDFIEQPIIYMNLIQDLLIIIIELVKHVIITKQDDLLKFLNFDLKQENIVIK